MIEFPLNSPDEVADAVQGWMERSTVICWHMDGLEVDMRVFVNFGLLRQVMITTRHPADAQPAGRLPVPILRAVLARSADDWDVQELLDDDGDAEAQ